MLIIGVVIAIVIVIYIINPKPARPVSYITDSSKTLLTPGGWKGIPVDAKGRFINEEFSFYQNFFKIFAWLPSHIISLVKNSNKKFPVVYVDADSLQKDQKLIWLSHASFFLKLNNINILIDPHFNNIFIYRLHTDNPVNPTYFKNIQYILLSHDHADHCDKKVFGY